jgi:cytochrome b561
MSDARGDYRVTAKILHWISALAILATIPAGLIMVRPGIGRALQDTLFVFHKNIGVIILLLILARLVYRAFNPAPPLPASVPTWQARIASVSHWALYAMVLVMAVTGYVRVTTGGFPLEGLDALGFPRFLPRSDEIAETAKAIHATVRIPLTLLIIVHIGAALHHAVVRRDGVFNRMWFGRA